MVEAKSKKVFYFTAFIIPCLILYLIFFIKPFFRGIGISFTNWDGLTPKTPIILEKNEFESKILFSSKLTQADRNYLQSVYEFDEKDNCYKRKSVGGTVRSKLERIVGKTGYEPERNKFVGLDNYKKIFTGKVSSNFYPQIKKVEKYTKASDLPKFISVKEFKGSVLKGSEKNKGDTDTILQAYKFDEANHRYALSDSYDEFLLTDSLWDMPEVTEKKIISESDLDSFIRTLKEVSLTQNAYELHKAVDEFSGKYKLSEDTRDSLIGISNKMLVISRLKIALSRSWIITQRNMGVIGFTLFFAVFSVIGINVLAFGLALALDTGIKGQKILRTIFFLPNVLSMIIVALIWSMLFVQLLPAITGIEKWISDSSKTPWLLVLVAVWQGCGYYMIVYLAGLQNIPTEIVEAAKIDGATGWQRFRYITLPMMIPSLTISLFLTIANALKSFDLIYAMIGPTGYATGTVPFVMDIYFDAFSLKQAGLATAKAMVLFFVIVIITGIQLYTMKRKELEA